MDHLLKGIALLRHRYIKFQGISRKLINVKLPLFSKNRYVFNEVNDLDLVLKVP